MTTGFTPRLLKGWWYGMRGQRAHRVVTTEASDWLKTLCGQRWRLEDTLGEAAFFTPCHSCQCKEARWLPESKDTP